MGSAVLNKSPSSFLAFVYGFLLISFLLNIPHTQGAVRVYSGRSRSLGVNDGASRVGAPPARHDSNAQRRPPKQSSPAQNSKESCGRGASYRSCLPGSKESRSTESGAPMYNWVEGVPPSYNMGGGLYPGVPPSFCCSDREGSRPSIVRAAPTISLNEILSLNSTVVS